MNIRKYKTTDEDKNLTSRGMSKKMSPQNLPMFVFPQSLAFYLDDQFTHKQILTLHNPYDFPVKFKVLCTAPSKYKVVDPEGIISQRHCVDIVIRHIGLSQSNCNVVDKFRIQMLEYPTKHFIGKKDVESKLLNGSQEPNERGTPEPELFQQLPPSGKNQQSYAIVTHNRTANRDTNIIAILAAVVSIIGLILPSELEPNNKIPDYLHLSINLKLIFSFVLGMVTIICMRL